jgi:lipopolysaccharide heptosyltransferase I
MAGDPRRITLVKLSSLGDVVHTLPVAAALRAHFPEAVLTWVVERREAAVLRDHPALNAIVVADTRGWRRARDLRSALAAGAEIRAVIRRLRRERADVALDLQGLLKSGVLTRLTRAPLRIGFARHATREPSTIFTNRHVTPPPSAEHVVDQYLSLLGPLGIEHPRVEFTLPSDADAESAAEEFFGAAGLKPRDRLVAILPGAGRPVKRWPPERFAALAARLGIEAGARVLVLWGPGEEAAARAIVAGAQAAVLAPPTSLELLIAMLRRVAVSVGADTGPLHLAAALGIACVGLYGPTSAVRNGPYGARHRALQSRDGTMGDLEVSRVLQAATELLG